MRIAFALRPSAEDTWMAAVTPLSKTRAMSAVSSGQASAPHGARLRQTRSREVEGEVDVMAAKVRQGAARPLRRAPPAGRARSPGEVRLDGDEVADPARAQEGERLFHRFVRRKLYPTVTAGDAAPQAARIASTSATDDAPGFSM